MVKNIKQRGDTIVEVLLALSVLSLVVGGAYAVANKAMAQSQQAHERTQALKIAEGQIEKLKYLSEATDKTGYEGLKNSLKVHGAKHCIFGDELTIKSSNDCIADSIFNYFFYDYSMSNERQFKVRVEWDGFGTNTKQNIELIYRTIK